MKITKEEGMRRGFTLLELMIVIIIIGVLATVGIVQYQTAIEKSRAAEARAVSGQLRALCAAQYMGDPTTGAGNCNAGTLGIGASLGQIPSTCLATNWFSYGVASTATTLTVTATRCTIAGGKTPTATAATAGTVVLTSNLAAGGDTWTATGVY